MYARYISPRYSIWRGSQTTSSALKGTRWPSMKHSTIVMLNSQALSAKAVSKRGSSQRLASAIAVPLAP